MTALPFYSVRNRFSERQGRAAGFYDGYSGSVAKYTNLLGIVRAVSGLYAAGVLAVAGAQSNFDTTSAGKSLAVKTVAEVQSRVAVGGHQLVRLVPADRVAPGDLVFYTLEVRNIGTAPSRAPAVTSPIPEHMRYIADSAVGPGAEVTFSVDGGRTFAQAEILGVTDVNGHARRAVASDYTHVRWYLKNDLNANSVAFVRFRAVVK